MVWLTLATSIVLCCLTLLALRMMLRFFQKELETLRTDHTAQRQSWEVERERLLNRCMTKEWESYAQMSTAMQVASSSSDHLPPEGLSDETEGRRWAEQHGASGLGEVFAELHGADETDIRGLGLSG